jgi:tetratricopeptide (TPR) repeat protein
MLARSPETAPAPADAAPAAATAPDFVEAAEWDKKGDAEFAAGRFEEAAAAYVEAYRESPDAFFVYNQALAIERLGRADEAADLYERYLVERGPAQDTLKIKSHIRKLRGEQIPEGEDDDEPPITAKGTEGSTAWFDRGQSAFLAKRFVKAADCFRRAFELVPHSAFVYNEGYSLELGGHPAAAANAYEHYVILDPGADDADVVIGKINALRGQAPPAGKDALLDPEEEASAVPEVTATGAAGAEEWFRRGAAANKMGDFKRAYDCFVNAYDLKPSPAFVYNQAKCLDLLGNVDAAVQAYERFLALDAKGGASLDVPARIKQLRQAPAGGTVKPAP